MALRLKRGSTADRTQLYFEEGELVYDIDLEQVFVGNGLFTEGGTIGGVAVGSGAGGGISGITDNTTSGSVITLTDVTSTFSNDIFLETGTILTGTGDIDLDGSITTDQFVTATGDITGENIIANGEFFGDITGNVFASDATLIVDSENRIITNTTFLSDAGRFDFGPANIISYVNENSFPRFDFVRREAGDISPPDPVSAYGVIRFDRDDDNGLKTGVYLQGGSDGFKVFALADGSTFNTAGSFLLNMDGNFGIGTATPIEKLDVNGSARINGTLTASEVNASIIADDSSVLVNAATGTIPYTVLDAGIASIGDVLKFDGAGWIASPDLQGTGGGAANVSAATQANPVVITTDAAHSFGDGQKVTITDVVGMTELNGNSYFVDTLTIDTFALYTDAALTSSVDGTAFTAYTSGGSAAPAPTTDAVTFNSEFPSYYLDYNNHTNTPTLSTVAGSGDFADLINTPTTIAGYGIIDAFDGAFGSLTSTPTTLSGYGITDAATSAQGALADTAIQPAELGSFTFTGSVLDTSDSSLITVTPAVTISSDLTVENDLTVTNKITVDTLEVQNLITAGAGTPELESETDILLTAGTRVEITQSPIKLASFTTAQRDALSAQNGDMIYNTTDNKFQGYENGAWVNLI